MRASPNTKVRADVFVRSVPLLADGIGLLLLIALLPDLTGQLQEQSAANVLLIGAVYALFCGSVYLIRKLERPSLRRVVHLLPVRWLRVALGVLLGIGIMLAISYQFRFLDSLLTAGPEELGEGEAAAFFVFAPGAWLGISLIYTLFITLTVEETIQWNSRRYPWLALTGLLGTNLMLLVLTAQIRAIFTSLAVPGNYLWFLTMGALLLLLLGPPRLLYLEKQTHPGVAFTFLALVVYSSWHITMS